MASIKNVKIQLDPQIVPPAWRPPVIVGTATRLPGKTHLVCCGPAGVKHWSTETWNAIEELTQADLSWRAGGIASAAAGLVYLPPGPKPFTFPWRLHDAICEIGEKIYEIEWIDGGSVFIARPRGGVETVPQTAKRKVQK